LRAALEGRQVPLLRGRLKVAQDTEHVRTQGGGEQSFIHLAIGDFGGDGRFAGGLHASPSLKTNGIFRSKLTARGA